ncbi:unnamed protein product [Miscanthus lutarioriparius]|uniref:Uncharacterized protein n=1 Tax=Miscanthus lutarioriparius TaxID=422564 RepID=A0A811MTM4_9POAL|nr:unnamed protein product [Miscanthus lutarioriparius]
MKAAMATCMPRLVRGGGCRVSTARPAASVSLLERIRDVVLRLIMLSAVSRASTQRTSSSGSGKSSKASSPGDASRHRESDACVAAAAAAACRRDDSIMNEAVEDCIEFLKRSSAEGDAAKLSTASTADAKLTEVGGEDKETGAFFILNVEARRGVSPSSGCRESI